MTGMPDWISDPTHDSPLLGRFPALGFVPCPGDAPEAKNITVIVTRTAKALDGISNVLHGTGDGDWQGKHAEAFREQFDDDFRPKIDAAKKSFRKAAAALRDWSDGMPEWQNKATLLESRAQDARDRHDSLKRKLAGLPPKPTPFDSPKDDTEALKRERIEKDRSSTELAASTAEAELEKIRAQARKLASDYILEGQSVARRLDKAMDIAPNEPGALHKLGNALKDIGRALGKIDDAVLDAIDTGVAAAVKWLSEHANAIAALGDVFATVSAALGAISLVLLACSSAFPPLALGSEVLAGAAGLSALGALALHGTARVVGGDSVVSNRTLAQDGLGVLPAGFAFKGVSRVVSASRAADALSNFGLVDTAAAFMGDPTALGYFAPTNDRQSLEAASGLVVPAGGPLLVAFENAWKAGSDKDRAAKQERGGKGSS
ncbi:hypothetical protein [Streptomyces sp. NPDC090053]|uniref:hypothetical protein n=1 Tax=Streptomyces sp. NPDC090053 TaxID=3365932 RepID=UPI00382757AB